MPYYKKLQGEKCYLSPVDPNDYASFTGWVNDMDAALGMIFLGWVIGEQKEAEVMNRLKDGLNFAIVDNATNRPMGTCGIPGIDERNKCCMVGIFIITWVIFYFCAFFKIHAYSNGNPTYFVTKIWYQTKY